LCAPANCDRVPGALGTVVHGREVPTLEACCQVCFVYELPKGQAGKIAKREIVLPGDLSV